MAVLNIYNDYSDIGINSRHITEGEEFSMVQDFIDYRSESFKSSETKQLAVFVETKINNSFPDLMFVEYNPAKYENWNSAREKLTTADLKILYFILKKRNVTSERIIKELSISYKSLLGSIEALFDANIVEREDGYWTIRNKQSLFGVKSIEAVEAKISKWDVVTQQAIQNSIFASESFVLSKRKSKPREEIIQRLGKLGIGIYLYDNEHFSCCSPARHHKYPGNYNSIFLNECIGRVLNS